MADASLYNVPQPAPFQQPTLVDCTTGCGCRVAYNAASCPSCGRADPAIVEGDPQKRTQARKDWDESALGAAWRQQVLNDEERHRQYLRDYERKQDGLRPEYELGSGLIKSTI